MDKLRHKDREKRPNQEKKRHKKTCQQKNTSFFKGIVPRDGLRRGASTVKVAFAGRFGFQPVTKGIQMHFVPTGIGGVGSCRQGAV